MNFVHLPQDHGIHTKYDALERKNVASIVVQQKILVFVAVGRANLGNPLLQVLLFIKHVLLNFSY